MTNAIHIKFRITKNKSIWIGRIICLFFLAGITIPAMMLKCLPRRPDPFGYLCNAAYFTQGKFNWEETAFTIQQKYSCGYSLFLVFLLKISNSYLVLSKLIFIFNMCCFLLMFLNMVKIADIIGNDNNAHVNTLICLAICLYPYFIFSVYTVTPELLFSYLVTLLIYLFLKLEKTGKKRFLFVSLFVLGLLYLTHDRAIVVMITVSIVIGVLYIKKDIKLLFVIITFATCIMYIIGMKYVTEYLNRNVYGILQTSISSENSKNTVEYVILHLKKLFDINGFIKFVQTVMGHAFYILVVSFGLVYIGIVVSIKHVYLAIKKEKKGTISIYLFVTFLTIGTIIASASMFMLGSRIDHLFYGRYVESIIPICLLVGMQNIKYICNKKFLISMQTTILLCGLVSYIRLTDNSFYKTPVPRTINGFDLIFNRLCVQNNTVLLVSKIFLLLFLATMLLIKYNKRLIIITLYSSTWILTCISSINREYEINYNEREPFLTLENALKYDDITIFVQDNFSYAYLIQLLAYKNTIELRSLDDIKNFNYSDGNYLICLKKYNKNISNNSVIKEITSDLGFNGVVYVVGDAYIQYLEESGYTVDNKYLTDTDNFN